MEDTYIVEYRNKTIGNVHLQPIGMYYKLTCLCKPDKPGKYVLYVKTTAGCYRLGLLIPSFGVYSYSATIARNRFYTNTRSFYLICCDLAPLVEGQPISDLHQIMNAKLKKLDGTWILEF